MSGILVLCLGSAFFAPLLQCSGVSRRVDYRSYHGVLAADPSGLRCKTVYRERLWYMLYGSYSLGRPDLEEVFATTKGTFRVVETKTGGDIAISILLGFLTSVTASSMELQKCAGGLRRTVPDFPAAPPAAPQPPGIQSPPQQPLYQQPQYQAPTPPAYQQPGYQPAQPEYRQPESQPPVSQPPANNQP